MVVEKMVGTRSAKRTVIVTNPAGLHARPSAAIAKTVGRFKSKVQIRSRNEVVDAGSILELLTLGAKQGSELVLTAKGPDAEQVLDAVVGELSKHYE
jgi:phosphotransferase system HPr (HPr) family protein